MEILEKIKTIKESRFYDAYSKHPNIGTEIIIKELRKVYKSEYLCDCWWNIAELNDFNMEFNVEFIKRISSKNTKAHFSISDEDAFNAVWMLKQYVDRNSKTFKETNLYVFRAKYGHIKKIMIKKVDDFLSRIDNNIWFRNNLIPWELYKDGGSKYPTYEAKVASNYLRELGWNYTNYSKVFSDKKLNGNTKIWVYMKGLKETN